MKTRRYKVVDVFTREPLLGNPVAVVLDAAGLESDDMQRIARWTNLSETTFLLPPETDGADYRLRIFTPRSELPFAGHPTLGSAHAVLEAGLVKANNGRLVQQCGVGLVELTVTGDGAGRTLSLALPPAGVRDLAAEDVDELEAILRGRVLRDAAPAIIDVGAIWVVAEIPSLDELLAMSPDFARSADFERRLGVTGITVFARRAGGGEDIEVRSFAPSCGVEEDPVCGSGNGSVAVFQRERHRLRAPGSHYTAAQGQCIERRGRISVRYDDDGGVHLGGACVTCIDGELGC